MTSIHLPFSLALLAVPALLALATALLRPSARRQSPVPEAVNHRVRLLVMGAFLCAGAARARRPRRTRCCSRLCWRRSCWRSPPGWAG